MEGSTMSVVTQLLFNILIGCFSLATLSWVFVGIQSFINDRKREKREQEREKRDAEYHLERMKNLKN